MFNNTDKRYNQYSAHLKEKFKTKVYKITLDAGFSCPNRDGKISTGGCIFCDEGGSFSQNCSNLLPIKDQVLDGIRQLSGGKYKATKFMSYFQAYSNTYKPVGELAQIYNQALEHKDIIGLSIGTRPDCVDDEKLDLIANYKDDFYTWVEYGMQTIHDKTLTKINRGHNFDCFLKAYEKTKERGISVCAHVILGLPDESKDDMLKTAKKLAELGVDGVKIHMLCALKDTKLAKMYEENEISFMSEQEYIQTVCDFIEILPKTTTIHRLAGNGLSSTLIAPSWLRKRFDTLNQIDREFISRNSHQGIFN